jgi:hypothetical protein
MPAAGQEGEGSHMPNGQTAPASPPGRGDRYKWVALANTTAAMFMATLDGSIVIIALPAIFRGIHLDPLAAGNISYLLWMMLLMMLPSAPAVIGLRDGTGMQDRLPSRSCVVYSQASPLARSRSPGYWRSFPSSAATIRPVSALVRR